jgi:acyl-CoA thioesterase-1
MVARRALLVAAAALALASCKRREPRLPPIAAGATVLALGDSITYGTGASPETSYPTVLATLSGWNVVNGGVPGDTSAQALARLPALLDEHKPALVLVSIGGNDLLRRLPDADVRANLERIVAAVRAAGAQPVLVGVPQPTLLAAASGSLDDHPLYADLAEQQRVPLLAGAWSKVLGDERLKSDRIHANAAGYRAFAHALHARLRELGIAP